MKKLRSIFCTAFLFIICAVMCVGCSVSFSGNIDDFGNNNSGNTGSGNQDIPAVPTFTLASAEETIIQALVLKNQQGGKSNRDVLEKFGKHSFNYTATQTFFDNDIVMNSNAKGVYDYANFDFVTGHSKNILNYNSEEYNEEYFLLDEVNYHQQVTGNISEGEFSIESRDTFMYVLMQQVFSEVWFNHVYGNEVDKDMTVYGCNITLKNGLAGVMYLNTIFSGSGATTFSDVKAYEAELLKRYSQELIDESYVKTTACINNNNEIIKIKFELVTLNQGAGGNSQIKYVIEIEPSNKDITQPQWVTDYLASKN